MITLATVGPLTLEGIRKLSGDGMKRFPFQGGMFLNMNSSKKNYEFDQEVAGLGPNAIKAKAENAPITLSDPRVGRQKRYVHTTFAGGVSASWEAKQDELYGFVRRHLGDLGGAMTEIMNIEATKVFDAADSGDASATPAITPLTGYDALSLLNTAHTNLDGTNTLDYKSNRVAVDLSDAAIMTGQISLRKAKDASGNKVNMGPANRLLVAPDNMFLVRQILETEKVPFSNENTKNVIAGSLSVTFVEYSIRAKRWILLCANHDLNWFMRTPPVANAYDDQSNLATVMTLAARWTEGFGDWRQAYGSPGT